MTDKLIETAFAELISTSICMDGVWYAPIEEIFSSIGTIVVLYGLLFGAALWFMQQLFDLCSILSDFVFTLWKKRKSSRNISEE